MCNAINASNIITSAVIANKESIRARYIFYTKYNKIVIAFASQKNRVKSRKGREISLQNWKNSTMPSRRFFGLLKKYNSERNMFFCFI